MRKPGSPTVKLSESSTGAAGAARARSAPAPPCPPGAPRSCVAALSRLVHSCVGWCGSVGAGRCRCGGRCRWPQVMAAAAPRQLPVPRRPLRQAKRRGRGHPLRPAATRPPRPQRPAPTLPHQPTQERMRPPRLLRRSAIGSWVAPTGWRRRQARALRARRARRGPAQLHNGRVGLLHGRRVLLVPARAGDLVSAAAEDDFLDANFADRNIMII